MGNSAGFLEFVVEQLGGLGDVAPRAMFGGHGLYAGPVFFGIVLPRSGYPRYVDAVADEDRKSRSPSNLASIARLEPET